MDKDHPVEEEWEEAEQLVEVVDCGRFPVHFLSSDHRA